MRETPMRSPTGGTPANIETTAAPCENPPNTIRVPGHRAAMSAMWAAASLAPFLVDRKLWLAG